MTNKQKAVLHTIGLLFSFILIASFMCLSPVVFVSLIFIASFFMLLKSIYEIMLIKIEMKDKK